MAESCYEPPYLPASFKLIPFKAIESTSEHGRRGEEGEFPFGESTSYADLGRRIRTYSIKARFDSNNHVLESAALIAAVELPGPGVLVHPTRGVILSAACKSLTVTDFMEEGMGVTELEMEFVEANNWPNGLSLVGQLLGIVIQPLITASRDNFSSNYQVANAQTFRQESVINAAQAQIANIASKYEQATFAATDQETRNRILLDLETLSTDSAMAATTSIMDRGIALGMNAVALNVSGLDKFSVFRDLANGAALSSSFLNPARDIEDSIYSNVRIIAAAFMTEGALEADEGSSFENLDIIEALLMQEISIAREKCQNHLYAALTKFRDEAVTSLYRKAYSTPGIVEYNFAGRVHPLVAAYSIYGDAKKHRDLETINLTSSNGRFGGNVAAENFL